MQMGMLYVPSIDNYPLNGCHRREDLTLQEFVALFWRYNQYAHKFPNIEISISQSLYHINYGFNMERNNSI